MVGFGAKLPDGALPVISVADAEEAQSLITLACQTNVHGDPIAPELVEEQTLENLEAFSARVDGVHDTMKQHGQCRCVEDPA